MQKIFDLSEEDISVLKEIQKANKDIRTDVAAIRFLIRKYKYEIIDPAEQLEAEKRELKELIRQMNVTLNIAERNTEVCVDALNTLLFSADSEKCVLKEEIMHPVIEHSEKRIKERIAHNKQKKDFRRS